MTFTHAAEHLLQEVSDKVLNMQNKKEILNMEVDAENDNESKYKFSFDFNRLWNQIIHL